METIRAYTTVEQSRKLAEILPLESADMYYCYGMDIYTKKCDYDTVPTIIDADNQIDICDIPCWSLAALLNILHSKVKNILSLSGGGYKDGKYISDWCLDYEFENGDYQKTFAGNPIDACVEMILKLSELKIL